MEKHHGKQHVAIVEPCVMAEVGLRHLLIEPANKAYIFHFFYSAAEFKLSQSETDYYAVVCCLSGTREVRLESLLIQDELANNKPDTLRIILGSDSDEVELVKNLSPTLPHGMVSKTESLVCLKAAIIEILNGGIPPQPVEEESSTPPPRFLSPTERAILHYMTCGYSLTDIAVRLERNIKTIRAHKFNAMAKLGVSSDIDLLSAADLMMSLPARGDLSTNLSYVL